MARAIDNEGDGGGYAGGGGTSGGLTGGGGYNWIIDPTPDTVTFNTAPAAGAAITVREYATSTMNATPVWALGAWCDQYGYPGEAEFFADRLFFASTSAQPQYMWASRIGDYSFFGKSTPLLDDDAIAAQMNARQLNAIVDLVPKQHLLALTTGGVWKAGGADSEAITPSTFSTRPQPSVGAHNLAALDVGESAIYLTRGRKQVRDLNYTFEADGYAGSDLTAFAAHLLELDAYRIVDWTFQAEPFSAVFAVRADGWMLSMTYKREHQVVAWARHDTDGLFLTACSIPEDGKNAVYCVVDREVGGSRVKYVERLANLADDPRDWVGLDSALSYDGRNASATLINIAGGDDVNTLATVTASDAIFAAANVGDEVVLDYEGEPVRITITGFTSATVVEGYPSVPLTDALRAPGIEWGIAADTFSGLDHLEGREVRVAGDGFDLGTFTVIAGTISGVQPSVVVHVGLPYVSDFQSLDMTLLGSEPVGTRQKLIRNIGVLVKNTRSLMLGPDFDTLQEEKPRDNESMALPPQERTGWIDIDVHGDWERNPSICIRNDAPFRCTILAVQPNVEFGT